MKYDYIGPKKAPLSVKEAIYVPEAGLEPARPDGHKILSLACLPIPPLGHQPLTRSGDHIVSEETVVWRAKDGIRTRDPDLGKVVLYQLSYFRLNCKEQLDGKNRQILIK